MRIRDNMTPLDFKLSENHPINLQPGKFNKMGFFESTRDILTKSREGIEPTKEEKNWLNAILRGGELINTCLCCIDSDMEEASREQGFLIATSKIRGKVVVNFSQAAGLNIIARLMMHLTSFFLLASAYRQTSMNYAAAKGKRIDQQKKELLDSLNSEIRNKIEHHGMIVDLCWNNRTWYVRYTKREDNIVIRPPWEYSNLKKVDDELESFIKTLVEFNKAVVAIV